MIEYFLTVGNQILIMALLVLVGYMSFKFKLVDESGIRPLSNILLKLVVPMVVISAFQREFNISLFLKWLLMFAVSLMTYIIQIIIATVAYRKKGIYAAAENKLSVVLANNGFLAFPLMTALCGELGVFLGSTNVILLNIFQWTYGVKLLAPNEKLSAKKIFLNPGSIAVMIGVLLFVSPWKLPEPVYEAVNAVGSLNTPLAMFVLGGLLAQTNIRKNITKISFYKISAIKLVLIPLIMMVILYFLPLPNDIKLIGFICSVTPSATSVSIVSQMYNGRYTFATSAVMITTVISAVTMPIVLTVGKMLLGY